MCLEIAFGLGFIVSGCESYGGMMLGSANGPAFLTYFIRNLRGGSQPILAQASDGLLYAVKFTNNLQGPNVPFNESMGSELYRAAGLRTPLWEVLQVSEAFLDKYQDCWIQTPEGRLRPRAGLCFGSRFLGEQGVRLFEILPGGSFNRIRNRDSFWLAWLIDVCAAHADNRQALFVEDAKGGLEAFFIDHGHLFGSAGGGQHAHFIASRYLDPRIYNSVSSSYMLNLLRLTASLDMDQLSRRAQSVPADWKTQSAVAGFERCLNGLSSPGVVQCELEAIVSSSPWINKREERKPVLSVLCPRLQSTRQRDPQYARAGDRSACA
jgi:hypothetical protein